jgi:CHRD domain-containing protein
MRHTSFVRLLTVAFAGLFIANRASALTYQLDANLDPFQEVPPHNTPGYGSADFTLDDVANTLTVNANTGLYADLLGGATVVLLQDAAVGANGPTLGMFTLDTAGNTSGTFSGSVGSLTAGQITDILNGNTYVNISDSIFPSGEIRGQILSVPEPGSIAILGCAGLLTMRRRTRAQRLD